MNKIEHLLTQEIDRQNSTINLIASENYPSHTVRALSGSILTSKYAEGYPGKRYYAGCEIIDKIESEAIEAAKKLFIPEHISADLYHVNVQPHSGSQANMAAYQALIQPNDTILSMNLAAGGHLSHGHPLNFSGKLYTVVSYGINKKTELIDYNEIAKLVQTHRPQLIIAGTSAYSQHIDYGRFRAIADSVGALLLADIAHIAGQVVTGMHPHPLPYADIITGTTHKTLRGPRGGFIICRAGLSKKIDSAVMPGTQGGPAIHTIAAKAACFHEALLPQFAHYQHTVIKATQKLAQILIDHNFAVISGLPESHLFLVDLSRSQAFYKSGEQAEKILESVGIILNKNMVPFDTRSPLDPSGIRIGLPAMVTRGCSEKHMPELASYIIDTLTTDPEEKEKLDQIKRSILDFASQFPVPE